jgi:uncharacterized protein YfaS (alpha-2-macroglobulin family)
VFIDYTSSFAESPNYTAPAARYWISAVTDRDYYNPGDTVHVKGAARTSDVCARAV